MTGRLLPVGLILLVTLLPLAGLVIILAGKPLEAAKDGARPMLAAALVAGVVAILIAAMLLGSST